MKTVTQIMLLAILCTCGPAFARQCRQEEQCDPRAGQNLAQTSELFQMAEARIRRLKWCETLNWNELIRTKEERYYPCWYFFGGPRAFNWNREDFLRGAMIYQYFIGDTAGQLLDRQVLADLTRIKEDRAQSHKMRSAAADVLRLADELGIYSDNVCRKRAAKASQPAADAAQAQRVQEAVPCEPGTVLAVAVDGAKSLCMLEGVEVILGEGDTISEGFGEGVKVVKIESGQVELQKGRHAWVQKIAEAPSDEWK